jgi:hypothetical protein
MRWLSRLILGAAVVVQAGYQVLTSQADLHSVTWWYGSIAAACFLLLAITGSRAFAGVLRIGVGLLFALSALAQLGALWNLGSIGVSVLEFLRSTGLTVDLNALVQNKLALAAAPHTVLITDVVCQLIVAFALVVGLWPRFFSVIAAVCIATYCAAWVLSGGIMLVVAHALPLLFAGTLFFALVGSSLNARWHLFGGRPDSDPFISAFDEAQQRTAHFRRAAHRLQR